MKTRLISIGVMPTFFLLIGISIILMGCERMPQQAGILTTAPAKQANAMIDASSDSGVTGIAVFTQNGDQITLTIEIQGATPGLHAVHIHANGDCSAPDGTSAGGHWNPYGCCARKMGRR